jgi:hypothetical protein
MEEIRWLDSLVPMPSVGTRRKQEKMRIGKRPAGDYQRRQAGLTISRSLFIARLAMKTIVFSLLLLGSLVGLSVEPLRAAAPPARSRGKVLILKNEFTIEGDIEQVGDRYRVRRGTSETWIPAQRVLCLTASLTEAYTYLRGHINLDDPDERLRLARWCRVNGLTQMALAELKAAAELRPDHVPTRRLLQAWQQAASAPKSAKPSTSAKTDTESLPPIDVTMESLGTFVTRVQPILTNTCARCHATGHGGKFRLEQVYENSLTNRRSLEHNLAAVLAQVNLQQPEASRLLTKAVADHAHTGQPPLRDRQSAPYRTLESWVKLTVASNPQLLDALPTSSAPASPSALPPTAEQHRAPKAAESDWGAEARPPTARAGPPPLAGSPPVPHSSSGATASPASPVLPIDPYDPEFFNQKMHPEIHKPTSDKEHPTPGPQE